MLRKLQPQAVALVTLTTKPLSEMPSKAVSFDSAGLADTWIQCECEVHELADRARGTKGGLPKRCSERCRARYIILAAVR